MNRRNLLKLSAAAVVLPALPARAQDQATDIREAYIYTYPMVKNYLTLYQYAVETGGDQYKGPMNEMANVARVYTPEDTAVITPNSDTPYSFVVLDLRAEPVVISLPPIEADRYYSLQLVDLYTNNVDYPGTRIDGNDGGAFLITGPGWQGEVPPGIRRVIEMPTWLNLGLIRTQLFSAEDLERVKEIQAGYKSQPLSDWAGSASPPPAPSVDWMPISDALMESDFWSLAAFLLPFAPAWPGDEPQREILARLGLTEGQAWPPADLPAETHAAMQAGILTGFQEVSTASSTLTDSSALFGTPAQMQGKYLIRAAAAKGGIYGNTVEEALYIIQPLDADGAPLDGSKGQYSLTFPKGGLPPVDAFWSLTMYDRKSQLLVENPLDRYLINSAMLDDLKADADGNITLWLQNENPGAEHEANWLPAPAAPFYTVLRLYLPATAALDGSWVSEPIRKI